MIGHSHYPGVFEKEGEEIRYTRAPVAAPARGPAVPGQRRLGRPAARRRPARGLRALRHRLEPPAPRARHLRRRSRAGEDPRRGAAAVPRFAPGCRRLMPAGPGKVLLTDGEFKHTLGIARALRARGHEVHLVARSGRAPAAHSRAVARTHYLPATSDPAYPDRAARDRDRAAAAVRGRRRRRRGARRRRDARALAQGRADRAAVRASRWPSRTTRRGPASSPARSASTRRARPRPESLEEARAAFAALGGRAVFKSRFEAGRKILRYVKKESQVAAAYEHVEKLSGAGPLVQEHVPGDGWAYFALYWNGVQQRRFMHRRVREWPPSGGTSAAAESVLEAPALERAGEALLDALKWHGVAMVEGKRAADGRFVLMEINAKFWGSHDLALAAGVDFPGDLVALLEGNELAPQEPYRKVRCSWPLGGDLWHGLARPLSLPRVLWDGVSPGVAHTFRWTDPVPSAVRAPAVGALDAERVARGARPAMSWTAIVHAHSRRSYDGVGSPAELAEEAVRLGAHVLAITDHDTWTGSIEAADHARARGLPLLCVRGSEVATDEGDVIALFVEEDPVEKHALALCDRVHAQGGADRAAAPVPLRLAVARAGRPRRPDRGVQRPHAAQGERLRPGARRRLGQARDRRARRAPDRRARPRAHGVRRAAARGPGRRCARRCCTRPARFETRAGSIWDEWRSQAVKCARRPDAALALHLARGVVRRLVKPARVPREVRVLHGTYEIAGQGMVLAEGLRAHGAEADSLAYRVDWDGRVPRIVVELDRLDPVSRGRDDARRRAGACRSAYDVFHFHFGSSFFGSRRALRRQRIPRALPRPQGRPGPQEGRQDRRLPLPRLRGAQPRAHARAPRARGVHRVPAVLRPAAAEGAARRRGAPRRPRVLLDEGPRRVGAERDRAAARDRVRALGRGGARASLARSFKTRRCPWPGRDRARADEPLDQGHAPRRGGGGRACVQAAGPVTVFAADVFEPCVSLTAIAAFEAVADGMAHHTFGIKLPQRRLHGVFCERFERFGMTVLFSSTR